MRIAHQYDTIFFLEKFIVVRCTTVGVAQENVLVVITNFMHDTNKFSLLRVCLDARNVLRVLSSVSIDACNVLRVTYFLLSGMARKTLYYSASSYQMFSCVTQTHQFCVSLSLGLVQDLQSMVVFCW